MLPAAVSPLSEALVRGPRREATVAAALPTALYLHIPAAPEHARSSDGSRPAQDSSTSGDSSTSENSRTSGGPQAPAAVLPLVTSNALLLPTAARLGIPSDKIRWPVRQGEQVIVGEGAIKAGSLDVHVVRTWHPARVVPTGSPPAREQAQALPASGALGDACDELVRDALAGRPVEDHVRELIGYGPGLTPSGDDALCGVMLALTAWGPGRAPLETTIAAVQALAHRTTTLSASLMFAAADGYALPQVAALVRALTEPTAAPLSFAVEAVVAVGHSSGRDLLSGLTGALRALSSAPISPPEGAIRG